MRDREQIRIEVVNFCHTCAEECIECARRCEDAGDEELIYCANLCRECTDACHRVIQTSAKQDDMVLDCAEACRLCAEECYKRKMDFCWACAKVVEKCFKKCNSLVKDSQLVMAPIIVTQARTTFGRTALLSGLLAGAVYLAIQLIVAAVVPGENIWVPTRVIAAIILGQDILQPPGADVVFDAGVVLAAIAMHFTFSVFFASLIGVAVRKVDQGAAIMIGGLIGLVIYFINYYGFTALFPWFEMSRNWMSIVSHLTFGVVAALTFVRIYHPGRRGEKKS